MNDAGNSHSRRLRTTALVGHSAFVGAVAFSPDGEVLASGSEDGTIILWDCQAGKLLRTLKGHRFFVNSVAFSPGGKTLVSGSGQSFTSGEVWLWKTHSGELDRVLVEDCNRVDLVAFSPDGKKIGLVTGSGSGPREPIGPEATLLDAKTGSVLWTVADVNSIAFLPDGKMFVGGRSDSAIGFYGVRTGKLARHLSDGSGNVLSVAVSSDGEMLATGSLESSDGKRYGAVKIWDAQFGVVKQALKAHKDTVVFVTFSPTANLLASVGLDNSVKLWSVRTGELRRTFRVATPQWSGSLQLVFSPNGRILASGSQDGKVRLWDVSHLTQS